jgi:acyl-coenzyme A thioesterase 13
MASPRCFAPALSWIGPFYSKGKGAGMVVGLRALEQHMNPRRLVHGGVLMTLADIALGYAMATTEDPPLGLITSNLSADIAGSAKLGDWIEARVDLQKIGRTLAFANAYLHVDEARIASVSGVFAVSRKG